MSSTVGNDILIYQAEDGSAVTEVRLERETVWLSLNQLSELFERDKSVISRHLRNIFKEGELDRDSVVAKNATTAADGKRYQVEHFNLDAVISVGYRVNSVRATRFRQWANRVLKDYLTRGYALDERRLQEQNRKLNDLRNTLALLEQTLAHQPVGEVEAKGLLKVIADYAYALTTLDRYDHGTLAVADTSKATEYRLSVDEAMRIVDSMKGEFDGLFGLEMDQGFRSALGAIEQTFDGKDVYPSVEEKAANLLYFVVKNHAFSDGNKRIAAAIFLCFMAGHGMLYRTDGGKRIADNALVALTLLIAESSPAEKDTIVKVIINLINRNID
ncbi:MAG: cytochrome C biogenesis protein CycH [Zetaproteobacteria bacterium CG06_land_8_20_14_3_00_59_53]|nr:MAG: cytochrome C biogenesis protein CycH [Zetaproteobacteria bacterium CG2_30_59_37]PIO90937.1 MAG: cytochrome C biogenesis protein CycH [Zetaproteobacteria bacterium CG23_combo_of_CG06-09_8_20_14_all_59_86]PIQ64560.1 MAG: cytochrome C biogenesis protein CycH [Zetaproteobacteria bacterium CG11_big_fil_rev_8_21_14_0_20_59_439]PIU70263.1 MAG: cytochrome C biogenesis protein CycH [Zetaproteobacteria bacterium CG06_land_8_20_14_3_00_59_53]PIU95974.1 MAG: cytochrome C biogenesis protein CycH [Ze